MRMGVESCRIESGVEASLDARMTLRAFWACLFVVFLGGGYSLGLAQGKSDALSRVEPVPDNAPIPVVDFFRPRLFSAPKLNPTGTHFAAIVSTGDDRADLLAFDLSTRKSERLTGGANLDIPYFEWLGERRLLFGVIKDKLYSQGLFAVELGRFSRAYVLQNYSVAIPVGFPRSHPLQVILWMKQSAFAEGRDAGVFKIDTRRSLSADLSLTFAGAESGIRADVVETYPRIRGAGDVVGYLSDREGQLAYAFSVKSGVYSLHTYAEKKWAISPIDLDQTTVVDVAEKRGDLLVLGPRISDKPRALHLMNAETATLGALILDDEEYDLGDVRFYRHPFDNRILGAQYTRKGEYTIWFDEGYHQLQVGLEKAIPGKLIRILGSDKAEQNFFVSAASDTQPVTYYHFNVQKNALAMVANVAPWIDSKRMSPMQPVSYTSRDGKRIEGYLTLTPGTTKARRAPLVVLPHGGPWVRDEWEWNAEVQFLASRGYAVFQPNYRGSIGSTWRFPADDQWAFRKMHEDVTDGVKAVLASGLLDPDRVAIMGSSFGGYLAISGVAYENDLYRCAITIAGIFDWERVIKQARGSEYARGHYGVLQRYLGDPKSQQEKFDEISPIKAVSKIKVPVYVAHGKEDPIASVAQSRQLISELKKYEIPFEQQIESAEGHGFRKIDHAVALYTAVEAFLAKHLGAKQ